MSDVARLIGAEVGSNSDLINDDVRSTFRETYVAQIANSVAGTAVTESVIDHVRRSCFVKGISITAPIAVTGDNTNNAVVTVAKRTGAGAQTVIAAFTTNVAGGNLAAFVPLKLPASAFTPANVQLAVDDVLTVAIAKGGTGVALSAATSWFTVDVDIERN